jgi:flagellar hook-associated protein 3 FlgL
LNTSVSRLIEAKDLVVQAKSIALSSSGEFERDLLSDQVQQIHDHLLRVANSQLGDDFLFSGTSVTTRPFEVDSTLNDVVYNGTDARQSVVVGREMTVNTSYAGSEIFDSGGSTIFQVLDDFKTALIDSPSLSESQFQASLDEAIGRLDHFSAHFLDVVGEQSTTLEHLDGMEIRNEDVQLQLERVISEISGADLTEAVVRLQSEQNLLQFTYATTAQMFELSLLDYV